MPNTKALLNVAKNMLNDWRRLHALPPFEEFTASRFLEYANKLALETATEAKLKEAIPGYAQYAESTAWDRVNRVMLCRVRFQFLIWSLPQSIDLFGDVIQSTLLKAHRSFASFEGTDERAYFAWLYAIQDNAMIDFAKKQRPTNSLDGNGRVISIDGLSHNWSTSEGIGLQDKKQKTPSHEFRQAETIERLYFCISLLDDLDQQVVLCKMAELTFEQIAVKVKVSKSSVCRLYVSVRQYQCLARASWSCFVV